MQSCFLKIKKPSTIFRGAILFVLLSFGNCRYHVECFRRNIRQRYPTIPFKWACGVREENRPQNFFIGRFQWKFTVFVHNAYERNARLSLRVFNQKSNDRSTTLDREHPLQSMKIILYSMAKAIVLVLLLSLDICAFGPISSLFI